MRWAKRPKTTPSPDGENRSTWTCHYSRSKKISSPVRLALIYDYEASKTCIDSQESRPVLSCQLSPRCHMTMSHDRARNTRCHMIVSHDRARNTRCHMIVSHDHARNTRYWKTTMKMRKPFPICLGGSEATLSPSVPKVRGSNPDQVGSFTK